MMPLETCLNKEPRCQSVAGFTLLEVLITIGLLAILMTVVYGAFARSLDVTRETAEVTDRVRQVQIITERLADELSSAYWFRRSVDQRRVKVEPRGTFLGTSGVVMGDEARFDRIQWTTFAHRRYLGDRPESDVAEVAYWVEPAADKGGGRLVREERVNLLSESGWAVQSDELADGVSEFRIRYFAKGQWSDEWDAASSANSGLPAAVEVTVALMGSGSAPDERLRTVVALPLASQ